MDLLVGLDIGTSALKGVLLSTQGQRVGEARRSVQLLRPHPEFVEVDPHEHYRLVCELVRELAARAAPADRIRALSMAVASGNSVLLDERCAPMGNIISWLDTRAVGRTTELLPELNAVAVHGIVGWPWIEMFPMAQLAWLRRHRSEMYARAAHRKMNIEHLLHRWTGRWCLDFSNATTSYLQDQVHSRWHVPYLQMLGMDAEDTSQLLPPGTRIGSLTQGAASDTGLGQETEVVLGAFDHTCAARGTGTLAEGDLMLSCGTSWAVYVPLAERALGVEQGMLVDPFLSPAGPWAGIAALRGIGVTIDWYIDTFVAPGTGPQKYERFNNLAQGVCAGAGGLFINPLRDIRGTPQEAHRLLAGHAPAQIARAVMEGAAFEVRRLIQRLGRAGVRARRLTMVGGPSESPVWPQIVADVCGLELSLINGRNAGAVGAAALAGIGIGLYEDEAQAFAQIGGRGRTALPDDAAVRRYSLLYPTYVREQEAGANSGVA